MKLLQAEAGVNDGKAGLLSAAGLFSKAGVFDKKSESFNILELDPYLLFDARESMLGTLENPTLDLDPATPSTLDVITATRSGTATYTDVNGNIATAAADTVRVDYTQGEELTPTKFQRVLNTSIGSPNSQAGATLSQVTGLLGEQDGIRVTEIATTEPHYGTIKADVVSGNTYTVSFYLKKGSYSTVQVYTQSVFIVSNTLVNFDTETASNNASMQNVGGGWYRIVMSAATALQSGTMSIYATVKDLSSYTGDVNNFTDYYGFQVEEGTTASDFVSNTTGSPKFIASATYGPRVPMILVEPSSENLVDNSTSFQTTGSVAQESGIDAPDGTNTATRITNISGASGVDAVYSRANSVSPSSEINGSIYLRGEAGKVVRLYVKRYSGGTYISTTAESVLLTGDWQRYESPSFTLNADNTNAAVTLRNDGDTTADSVDLWGGQIESGSVSTSLIPTSGSTVTRQADDLVISGSDFTDFFNSGGDGTFYAEFTTRTITGEQVYVLAGHSNTQRYMYSNADGALLKTFDGYSDDFGGDIQTTLNRASISYNSNSKKCSVNGASDVTHVGTGDLQDSTRLSIGQSWSDQNHLNGHIKRLIYWPYHSDSL